MSVFFSVDAEKAQLVLFGVGAVRIESAKEVEVENSKARAKGSAKRDSSQAYVE